MNCQELRTCLDAYVNGELEAQQTLDADAHLAFCMPCQWVLAREREFRQVLRTRAKRETTPPALRERVHSVLNQVDRAERRQRLIRWLPLPMAAAALVLLALWSGSLTGHRTSPESSAVMALTGKHLAYAQMDAPAEFSTGDRQMVAGWFKERVHFSVPVPDFTPSGIRLVGGRISEFSGHQAAYLLYEKGRSLVSLFVFPSRGLELPESGWERIGQRRYFFAEFKGQQVVIWTQGESAFALVSQLNRDALLECAEAVWLMVTRGVPTT